jgi:hypothetical protein
MRLAANILENVLICLPLVNKMKNNKSPGSDGFTSEFLKFFWKDLKVFVIGSLN